MRKIVEGRATFACDAGVIQLGHGKLSYEEKDDKYLRLRTDKMYGYAPMPGEHLFRNSEILNVEVKGTFNLNVKRKRGPRTRRERKNARMQWKRAIKALGLRVMVNVMRDCMETPSKFAEFITGKTLRPCQAEILDAVAGEASRRQRQFDVDLAKRKDMSVVGMYHDELLIAVEECAGVPEKLSQEILDMSRRYPFEMRECGYKATCGATVSEGDVVIKRCGKSKGHEGPCFGTL